MTQPVHGHFHLHAPKAADQGETLSERIMAGITRKVGTLACAIVFAVIAFLGAPAKFAEGTKGIIEWLAQQFLQLVLLAIILGGQRVSEKMADAQTKHMALGIDTTLDALDTKTEGGLKVILAAIEAGRLPAVDAFGERVPPSPKPKAKAKSKPIERKSKIHSGKAVE
jgi:uncharacterized protein YqgV (UPF0045/DUF77 family)